MKRVTYLYGRFSVWDVRDQFYAQEDSTMYFQDRVPNKDAVWELYSRNWKQLEEKIQPLKEEQYLLNQAYEAFLQNQEEREE